MKRYTIAEDMSGKSIFLFAMYLFLGAGSLFAIIFFSFRFSKTIGIKETLGAIGFTILLIFMLVSSVRTVFAWKTIELDDIGISIKWHSLKKDSVFTFDMISEIRFVSKDVFETDWGERTRHSIFIIGKKTEILFECRIDSVPDIPVDEDLPIKIAYHVIED